jgi:hypothetical protein
MKYVKFKFNKMLHNELFANENNLRLWIQKNFMAKTDKFTFARNFFIFTLLAFYLGNNLILYLWLYCIIFLYKYIYRLFRFYATKKIAYMAEFCYFGNFCLLYFIFFKSNDESFFKIPYIVCTGVLSIATIELSDQANFNSSDHLTTSFLHILPMLTCWAIRWKKYIYWSDDSPNFWLSVVTIADRKFEFDDYFWELVYLPYTLLFFWLIIYVILVKTILKHRIENPNEYRSALSDFTKAKIFEKIFGDLKSNTLLKYIVIQIVNFFFTSIFAIASFYNYYFNTVFLLLIIGNLGFNTSRKHIKNMEKDLINAGRNTIIQTRRSTLNNLNLDAAKISSLKELNVIDENAEKLKAEDIVSDSSDEETHDEHDEHCKHDEHDEHDEDQDNCSIDSGEINAKDDLFENINENKEKLD